jgi:Ca2+-binding RTX toxin-like protein
MQYHNTTNYVDQRYALLKLLEGEVLFAYADTKGIPTIGIGLNLRVHGRLVLQSLGFDFTGTQLKGAALVAESGYINALINLFSKRYPPDNTASNQALADFNAILRQRAINPVYANVQNFVSSNAYTVFRNTQSFSNRTFTLLSTQSSSTFTQAMDGYTEPGTGRVFAGYEANLDNWLNVTGAGVAQPGLLVHANEERLALLSLGFNSQVFITNQTNTPWNDAGLPKLLGGGLTTALLNNNRAEAWYEIRYGSNGDRQNADRRYVEANEFWLYDATITVDSAKEVMRMYTVHKAAIIAYENTYSPALASQRKRVSIPAIGDYAGIGASKNYLIANFARNLGMSIDGEVIVGAGLSSYAYKEGNNIGDIGNKSLIGTDKNDLIFGEAGNDSIDGGANNDVIYGGLGDDILRGGKGDDLLMGGADDDTYIIDADDGKDTIEDKQGNNKVILCGNTLNFFYDKGNYQYSNADGTITAVMRGTDLVVTHTNGTQVILNEDFEWGDFGINLNDTPTNPETTNTIICDNEHFSFEDTAANDSIVGTDNQNEILIHNGGIDWALGNGGNDRILAYGSGNVILEGGAGNDKLAGSSGDDKIFADSYGEMEDLVAAGETAESIDELGEDLLGGAGDDFVYGSNKHDSLAGEAGNDLIVGGGGNDWIVGDYDQGFQGNDWDVYQVPNVDQGNDVIYAGTGNDTVYGNDGNDEDDRLWVIGDGQWAKKHHRVKDAKAGMKMFLTIDYLKNYNGSYFTTDPS